MVTQNSPLSGPQLTSLRHKMAAGYSGQVLDRAQCSAVDRQGDSQPEGVGSFELFSCSLPHYLPMQMFEDLKD
ncbi:unnamed protein product [Merluccius merluccius]